MSTDHDDQLASLESQKRHYESLIRANSEWENAGIYVDEGISGTKRDGRTGRQTVRDFLNGQTGVIVKYDGELVKGLVERVIIYKERISVILVSRLESDVKF